MQNAFRARLDHCFARQGSLGRSRDPLPQPKCALPLLFKVIAVTEKNPTPSTLVLNTGGAGHEYLHICMCLSFSSLLVTALHVPLPHCMLPAWAQKKQQRLNSIIDSFIESSSIVLRASPLPLCWSGRNSSMRKSAFSSRGSSASPSAFCTGASRPGGCRVLHVPF